jgi:GNAT superfamily N-acetyltransferase
VTPRIVPFDGSAEAYLARVALLKDAQPAEPWSVEGERAADEEDAAAGRPGGAFFAAAAGDLVGFARYRLDPTDPRPGRRRLWLAVAHRARGQRAGSALFSAVGQAAAAGGATEFLVTTSLAEPDGRAFALRRGFAEVEAEVELHLDLPSLGAAPTTGSGPPGLLVADLASLSGSAPDWSDRYYALYAALAVGIMWASPAAGPGREAFRRSHLEAPGLLAEGTAVALLDGEWVGLGELWRSGDDRHTAYLELTGVLPACRRRGIGRVLVAAVAGRAARLGFRRLLTSTGTDNEAMQVLARRTGFTVAARWSYLVGPVMGRRVLSGQEVGS